VLRKKVKMAAWPFKAAAWSDLRGILGRGAENGLQALDALLAAQYDCVSVDIQMPGMKRVAAINALRSARPFEGASGCTSSP